MSTEQEYRKEGQQGFGVEWRPPNKPPVAGADVVILLMGGAGSPHPDEDDVAIVTHVGVHAGFALFSSGELMFNSDPSALTRVVGWLPAPVDESARRILQFAELVERSEGGRIKAGAEHVEMLEKLTVLERCLAHDLTVDRQVRPESQLRKYFDKEKS